MPQRFFISPNAIQRGNVVLPEAQARQIRDVLRMSVGQEVIVLDNAGSEYRVELSEVTRNGVRGKVVEQRAVAGEPATKIVLYQALLKADKFEWVLQKGTESGIDEFVPVVTARSIADKVGNQKVARWNQIVAEAAEQARRGKIPPLMAHQSLERALDAAKQRGGLILIPWEEERALDLKTVLARSDATLIHLFIGPEGGFTEREIQAAAERGAQSITLGSRILRAETAGLVAAAAILFARGDLSGA